MELEIVFSDMTDQDDVCGNLHPRIVCFKHAVKRAMKGSKIETEIMDSNNNFSCMDCLDEAIEKKEAKDAQERNS